MHALGPKIARQRFRQDALRGLGRREARETRLAAQGGGVAGDDQSTLAGGDHRRRRQTREMQHRHRVDFKIALEDIGIDLAECPERAPNGILYDHFGCPEGRSEEHTSELQSLMRSSYAVFCLKK